MFGVLRAATTTTLETSSPRNLRPPSPRFVVFMRHCSGEQKPEENTRVKKTSEEVEKIGFLLQKKQFRSAVDHTKTLVSSERSKFDGKYNASNLYRALSLFSPFLIPVAGDAVVTACCELDFLDEATEVFSCAVGRNQRHQLPSIMTFRRLMDRLVDARMYDRALTVFSEISDSHVCYLDTYTYNMAIQSAVKLGAVDRALDMKVRMERRDRRAPDTFTYNVILSGLWKNCRGEDARKLFDELKGRGLLPTCVTYNTMLHGYIKEGKFDEVCRTLESMKLAALKPSHVTYNSIISGLCRASRMDESLALLNECLGKGIKILEYTSGVLLNGLCKAGKVSEAERVLNRLQGKGLLPQTFLIYNIMIAGNTRLGNANRAVELVSRMESRGLKPSLHSYNSTINCLCRLQKMDEAAELVGKMVQKGMTPIMATYNPIINGYARSCKFMECYKIIIEMQKNTNLKPDAITYGTIMNGLCKNGEVVVAENLLQDMVNRGITPTVQIYSILLAGFCRCADFQNAFRLLEEMKSKGITPNLVTYNSFISGLCKVVRLVEAEEMVVKLKGEGLTPDVITYTSLIQGYLHIDIQRSLYLYHEMQVAGIRPTKVTFSVLLSGLITKGMMEKVHEIHNQMRKNDIVLDRCLYRSDTCIKENDDVQRTCLLLQDMS